MTSFLHELKRRNVYKVAAGYGAVAWVVTQAIALLAALGTVSLSLSETVFVIAVIGFVVALVIAWFFEMTPEGMKRTRNLSPDEKLPYWSRRKFTVFVSAMAVIGFVMLAVRYLVSGRAA